MANEQAPAYRILYGKLVALYPKAFRERFEESMLQTFDDLCNEPKKHVLWTLADTATGVAKEHALQIAQRSNMNDTIINPKWAATVGIILCLPFLLSYTIAVYEIEPLLRLFKSLVSEDGQQLNMVGRLIIFGGVFLLPVAFLVNFSSMLTRRTVEKRVSFRPHPVNAVLGGGILFFILSIAYWMIVEAINCSTRGICD